MAYQLVHELDEDEYQSVLYLSDATLSVEQVADIFHAVSKAYPQDEIQGLEYAGADWL